MLKIVNFLLFATACIQLVQLQIAPVLDIDDEKIGYTGTIGERNILVDLKPHLQIRNIDQINGICSYHVFKPNNEEFPFTIDIKDKQTGEAVIEVVKKDLENSIQKSSSSSNSIQTDSIEILDGSLSLQQQQQQQQQETNKEKFILLDCNKRKEFSFFIQAHDCSTPSLPSNKIPVKIEVLDHDDFPLKFENSAYTKRLVVSDQHIYENIMTIKAHDNDCTNNGNACSYKLITLDSENDDDVKLFPFKIDPTNGVLSSKQPLNKLATYDFKVRAYDCVNKDSFVDALVHIDLVEPCVPQWMDFVNEIKPIEEATTLFNSLKITSCDEYNQNLELNKDTECKIESVEANVKLELQSSINNQCVKNENCNKQQQQIDSITSKLTLFSGKSNEISVEDDLDDSDISEEEKEEDDESNEVKSSKIKPLNFKTFTKNNENAEKIDFDGKFGDEFTLNVWIRRPASADKQIKEQVLCGSDASAMNRHHFGLYFYRGNIKFLMRKEASTPNAAPAAAVNSIVDTFYPSLWQWTLDEKILNDGEWHFYEIKLNYPKANLYIDGQLFAENLTNSDIIDAYELKNDETYSLTTYIGACFHARTKTLVDHFEGDIGPLKLIKTDVNLNKQQQQQEQQKTECTMNCMESIEINMIGNEKYLNSIKQNSNQNEIRIQTSSLNELNQIVSKISYKNKKISNPQVGSRNIILTTAIQCGNNGKKLQLNNLNLNLIVKHPKREYNIELKQADNNKLMYVTKLQLVNGIKPFSKLSIEKKIINNIETSSSSSSSSSSSEEQENDSIELVSCQLHANPNLNQELNYEKHLLDQFKLNYNQNSDGNLVQISGTSDLKNYESFLKSITFQTNDDLTIQKFQIECIRNEPKIQTNSFYIQLNVTHQVISEHFGGKYLALKQNDKLVVSEVDDTSIVETKHYKSNNLNEMSTPLVIALIVMCAFGMGFLLVFGAIRLHSIGVFGSSNANKKKNLINEENPQQLEWDDSGLNIIENPLETFEANKKFGPNEMNSEMEDDEEEDEEEYSSYDEDEDEEEEEEDEDYDQQYSSDDQERKQVKLTVDRELEWDDTSIEIKDKRLQKVKSSNSSNKIATSSSSVNFSNKFV